MNDVVWGRADAWPWLLALPLLAVLAWALYARSRAAIGRYGVPAPAGSAPLPRAARLTLLAALGLVAWLDPRWGDEPILVERRGLDLIVCLDTSRSMLAGDMDPTRLRRATEDVRAVLPELTGGDRVGLVVFAGTARIHVPLTHDLDAFRALLDDVDTTTVRTGGTDLAAALRKALELAAPDDAATTVVLLLTDGEDLAGAGQQAASELRERGLVVHAVGYGSALGSKITVADGGGERFLQDRQGNEVVSKLDDESLRRLAGVTGGEFVRAEAMALPLNQLHRLRLAPMTKRAYDAGEETGKHARYQWVLLPLLALLLWEIAMAGGRHR